MVGCFRKFAAEDFGLSLGEIDAVMNRVYTRGDRLMVCFVLAHALLALYQAGFYGTWTITLGTILFATSAYMASLLLAPRTRITRVVGGIALQVFVGLFIYQLHGLAEMHFYHFTAQTMLVMYEDWFASWPGVLLAILGECAGAFLQNSRVQLHIFSDTRVETQKLVFHFGIILFQAGICTYWTILQRRRRLESESQHIEAQASRECLEEALVHSREAERTLEEQTVALKQACEDANQAH